MKRMRLVLLGIAIVLFVAANSWADVIEGAIWQITGYNSGNQTALFSHYDNTLGDPLATFTINTLNCDSQALTGSYGGAVTYDQFLSNSLAGSSGPNPNGLVWTSGAAIANQTVLTDGTNTSFFQFIGTANFSSTFSIRHDDGAVLFLDYDYGNVYNAAYPTAPEVSTFSLSTYGLTPGEYGFLLNYAAWNGYPEVIQFQSGITNVPEPTTMLLLGLGLIGISGFRKRMK